MRQDSVKSFLVFWYSLILTMTLILKEWIRDSEMLAIPQLGSTET